jgi:CRP-like cAMP-binding protein
VKFTPAGNKLPNRVLASLSEDDLALIQDRLRPTELRLRQFVQAANRPVQSVYFPYSGIISIVAQSNNRQHQAEIGLVGCEGMTGLSILLATELPVFSCFVQVEGHGVCLSADELRELIQARSSLRTALLRYAHAFLIQAGYAALANAEGTIEQRLARWLLMAHDRLPGDELRLTQEFLALTLGVRRAGVTIALGRLQAAGLISTARGAITITDRIGLEHTAGGFYGAPERALEGLLKLRVDAS